MPKTGKWTGGTIAGQAVEGGPANPQYDTHLAGSRADVQVGGVASFLQSPRVPNPAALLDPTVAPSLGEVQQLIASQGSGTYRSMGPLPSTLPAISNSSAEISLLAADHQVPRLVEDAVVRVTAAGLIANTSGGPVTFTVRLRNQTNGLLLVPAGPVTLASDALGQRPWRFEAVMEGQFFLATGPHTVGHLWVGAGNTDPLQQAMGQQLQTLGSDPQSWRVTGQLSVASANASVTVYTAQIAFAFPGG